MRGSLPLIIMPRNKYWQVSLPPPSLPICFDITAILFFHLFTAGVPSPFAGIMSCMFGFFQLSMLDLNKRPNYPKWWRNHFLSQQKKLTQNNTMPVKIVKVFRIRNKKLKHHNSCKYFLDDSPTSCLRYAKFILKYLAHSRGAFRLQMGRYQVIFLHFNQNFYILRSF